MDPFGGDPASLAALVEFLYAQSGGLADPRLAERGRRQFLDAGCESCHSLGTEPGEGPALGGWASASWLEGFIRAPAAARFYGKDSEMESFGPDRLTDAEVAAVAAYVRAREKEPVKFSSPPPSNDGRVRPSKEKHP